MIKSNESGLRFLVPLELNLIADSRGSLAVFQVAHELKFSCKRVYWMSNVPRDVVRGRHAHKKLRQIFLCVSGEFTLSVTDGKFTEEIRLRNNQVAYYLPNGYWRELKDFTKDATCLVLASEDYEVEDYIFEFHDYLFWRDSK
jgi:dTDP-4-dehydrorhamnose 3,5-epimerase-like enzyme